MHLISVDVSPKQASRLRNGHKVRVKRGKGVSVVVNPINYNLVSRAFRKSKGVEIKLSPEEIEANKMLSPEKHQELAGEVDSELFGNLFRESTGEGLFGKLGRTMNKGLKSFGHTLEEGGKQAIKGVRTAEQAVRKNPTSRAIIKKALPILAKVGTQGALMYAGMDPKTAAELSKVSAIGTTEGLKAGGYGLYAGRSRGGRLSSLEALREQNLGTAHAGSHYMDTDGSLFRGKHSVEPVKGYYHSSENPLAPPSRGYGLRSRHNNMNLIRGRGSLISHDSNLPPALQSQPYGVNFHMQFQLPPQYQRYNNGGVVEGEGLYV